MNSENFNELRDRAAGSVDRTLAEEFFDQSIRKAILDETEKMVESGQAYQLTDEEERLLRSFRRFHLRCKPGAVFKWQTRPVAEGVTIEPNTGLISDPHEVVNGDGKQYHIGVDPASVGSDQTVIMCSQCGDTYTIKQICSHLREALVRGL